MSAWRTPPEGGEPASFDGAAFPARLDLVRERIARAASDPSAVSIVAVTKGFGPDAVTGALAAGLNDIGENYASELLAKASTVQASTVGGGSDEAEGERDPVWHFLGAVQRNKIPRLAPVVSWWQGVSRLEEATAIATRSPEGRVLVQVDVAGIPGRGGCPPSEVRSLVEGMRELGREPVGLMAVGPPGPPEATRPAFAMVSRLADSLDLPVRSLGMSEDFEVALQEGSTMVRLGRALFGSRPPKTRS